MKTRTKALLLALCAVLLVVTTVFTTLAYMTSITNEVTNTFTVGNVSITLDEAKVKTDGNYETNATNRTDKNTYHLIPNTTYIKDPTVHVLSGSENAYLFARVTVGADIAAILDNFALNATWQKVDGYKDLYVYIGDNAGADEAVVGDYVLFNNIKIAASATNKQLEDAADDNITVKAYAVQAAGVDPTASDVISDAATKLGATAG